jgi:DNA-binding NarL/FixJ family response regulator
MTEYTVHEAAARKAVKAARRERQVAFLKAVMRTGSQKAAADALGVRVQHVKNTLCDLYDRLGVSSTTEAVYVLWLRDLWKEGADAAVV